MEGKKVEIIKNQNGFDCSFVIDNRGFSGGLALIWKSNLDVELVSYTQWHISMQVTRPIDCKKWIFIGFYENPITIKVGVC